MAERNFKQELDRVIEQFERDSAKLERVWSAFGARGNEYFDVSKEELTEIEEACTAEPAKPAPKFPGALRC